MASSGAGVIRRDQARALMTGSLGAYLLADGGQTGGGISFVVHTLAPRALGSPVHTHRNEDEWSYVLDGVVGVEIGEETFAAEAEDVVLKPRGVPHAFWNAGDQPARVLEVITPAGFEGYFTRLGEVLAAGGMPDPAALAEVAAAYDLVMDLSSIPRLVQEHGLSLG